MRIAVISGGIKLSNCQMQAHEAVALQSDLYFFSQSYTSTVRAVALQSGL
jgi:hypothetical protein